VLAHEVAEKLVKTVLQTSKMLPRACVNRMGEYSIVYSLFQSIKHYTAWGKHEPVFDVRLVYVTLAT
jgi:hypothetical protein